MSDRPRAAPVASRAGAAAVADPAADPLEAEALAEPIVDAPPDAPPPPPPLDSPTAPELAGRPRIPMRTEWVELPGDYGKAGMKMRVWVDYEFRYSSGIRRRGDVDEALRAIVLEHNGWLNQRGEPLPPIAEDDLFWWRPDIPPELVITILGLLEDVPRLYPKSLGLIFEPSPATSAVNGTAARRQMHSS